MTPTGSQEARSGWDAGPSRSVLLAEFPMGPKSAVRVELVELDGRRFASIRVWYRRKDGTLGPTTRGTTTDVGDLPALRDAIDKGIQVDAEWRRQA